MNEPYLFQLWKNWTLCLQLPRQSSHGQLEDADYKLSEEMSKERMNQVRIELNNISMKEKIMLGNLMKDKDSPDFPST